MTTAAGTFDPRFEALADLLHANVENGTERGASLCVIQDGEVIVDIWDGHTDLDGQHPWQGDTLAPVMSITKLMANLSALVLVDRGEVEIEAPVARYWPEFAAAGKDGVTVAHLLGHTSGLPAWEQPVTMADVYDWDTAVARLAEQAPWWEPGTLGGYHSLSQGHLVGELVRRVTGDSLGTFFAREIAAPLGADFHIGLDPEHDDRVSTVTPPRMLAMDEETMRPDGVPMRALSGPFMPGREWNTEQWRRSEVPAANGVGNARSVALVQSLISHGGEVNGVRLLSAATVDRVLEVQYAGTDVVLGVPIAFGLGWSLPEPRSMPAVPPGRRCYWGGLGGSVVVNDLEHRTTFAYVMNKMFFEYAPGTQRVRPCGDARSDAYLTSMYEALAP